MECLKRRLLKGGGDYFSTAIWMAEEKRMIFTGQVSAAPACSVGRPFVGRVHSLALFLLAGRCVVRSVRRPAENGGEVHWRAFRTARSSSVKSRPVVLLNFGGQTTAHSHGRTGQRSTTV